MSIRKLLVCAVLPLAGVCAFGYDADTMALYPFMDGEAGTEVGTAADSVKNAIDPTLYGGKGARSRAYASEGEKQYTRPFFSDDVPGNYIIDGAQSGDVLWGPGEYQSILFDDYSVGTVGGVTYALETNAVERKTSLTYKDSGDAWRPYAASTVSLANLGGAIAAQTDWTIEFFYKHISSLSSPNSQDLINIDPTKVYLSSCYGNWYVQDFYYSNGSKSNHGKITYDTSVNLAELGWQHIAIVHTGVDTTTRIYRDYQSVAVFTSHVMDASSAGAAIDVILGDYRTSFPGRPFYGYIAALRVTKRELAVSDFLVAKRSPPARNLTIDGDYEVPSEGLSCNSLIVNGPATITGGNLVVQGDITVSGGAVVFDNAEVVLESDQMKLSVAADSSLRVNAPISGSADIALTTDGVTAFAGANTFSGKLELRGHGEFHACSDAAFGLTTAGTTVYSREAEGELKLYFDGIETAEDFESYFMSSQATPTHFSAGTVNVLKGMWTNKTGHLNYSFDQNSRTVLSNEIAGAGFITSSGHSSAVVDVCGLVSASRYYMTQGTFYFHHRVNTFENRNYGIMPGTGVKLVMCAPNVFAASDDATSAYPGADLRFNSVWTFDLNGCDQRARAFTGTSKGLITSAQPAVLHVDADSGANQQQGSVWVQDSRMVFNGSFEGQVSLSVEGGVPFDLAEASASTGALLLSNGAQLSFIASGAWAGTNVTATGASTVLTLATASAFGKDTVLTLNDGATAALNFGAARMPVGSIVIDGTEYTEGGTYGSIDSSADHKLASLTGMSLLVVRERAARTGSWNVPSAGGDAKFSTAANWGGDGQPEFATGLDRAVFSTAGETAIVDIEALLSGIAFTRPADGRFSLLDGGGALGLGPEGFAVDPGTSDGRHYTNDVTTTLLSSQTWHLPGTGTEFVQNGRLVAGPEVVLTVKGNADLHLTNDNSDFHGSLNFNAVDEPDERGCVVHVWHDHALGAPEVPVYMQCTYYTTTNTKSTLLFLHGDRTIENDIRFAERDSVKFAVDDGARVEFKGDIVTDSIIRPLTGTGAEILFTGNFTGRDCYRVAPPTSGKLVFSNDLPQTVGSFNGKIYGLNASDAGLLAIYSPSNAWTGSYGIEYEGNIRVEFHAPYALMYGTSTDRPKIRIGNHRDIWTRYDLCGFDQSCAHLCENVTDNWAQPDSHAVVESVTPAQLHVHQNTATTVTRLAFEGAAGLTMEAGTAALTLGNVASGTSGKLEIAGGTLNLAAGWTNATEVAVSSGALNLQADDLFNRRRTVLRLSGGALDLGGTTQRVYELYVNGRKVLSGDYTKDSEELGGLVTGSGTLRVCGHRGLSIMIR